MKSFVLGLTGGTGTGKSTAAAFFQKNGAFIIDADAISRSLMQPGTAALEDVAAGFPGVLRKDGTLDRKKLADIVFHDDAQLNKLNALTHTYIREEILRLVNEAAAPVIVIDAPLLFEAELHHICDKTLCVLSDTALRAGRIMERDSLTEEEAMARISAQKNDDYYKNRCDCIVDNTGDVSSFEQSLSAILKEIFCES